MQEAWKRFFDEGVERHGTDCVKWDELEQDYGNKDAIALWVADMDFPAPKEVIDAIVARATHGAFGYTIYGERHFLALKAWLKTRHGLSIQPEWVTTSPGVVDSMVFCLRALAKPGTKVAIFSPVYGPFYSMGELAGYEHYISPLRLTDQGWRMDLDNLEDGFKQGDISTVMLCNPHNPIGREWTRQELTDLVNLCNRYGVRILSDEIHIDFEMPGYRQVPLLTIPGTEECVMLTSATKTFNLAALRHSSVIAPDKAVMDKIKSVMHQCMASGPNLFGYYAQTAAYEKGATWLDNLLEYLDGNRAFVEEYLEKRIPEITSTRLEGTYLKFLDMRRLGMEQDALMDFLSHKANLAFNNGLFFGEAGRGFVRMNLATQRGNLEKAMENLEKAVHSL